MVLLKMITTMDVFSKQRPDATFEVCGYHQAIRDPNLPTIWAGFHKCAAGWYSDTGMQVDRNKKVLCSAKAYPWSLEELTFFFNIYNRGPFDPIWSHLIPFVHSWMIYLWIIVVLPFAGVLDLPLRELRTKMRRCLPALRTTRATGCPKEERAAARAQVGESGVGTRCLDDDLRQDVSGGQEMSRFREASQNYRTVQVGEWA